MLGVTAGPGVALLGDRGTFVHHSLIKFLPRSGQRQAVLRSVVEVRLWPALDRDATLH